MISAKAKSLIIANPTLGTLGRLTTVFAYSHHVCVRPTGLNPLQDT
jgi:hypothetical protein